MKSVRAVVILCLGPLFLLWATAGFGQSTKTIHLRNERIVTPAKQPAAKGKKPARALSGLFVIQFEGPVQEDWRKDLQRLNVKLLRFVPQDSFVARLKNVAPEEVEALPFVRWIGSYRAEYKIHGSLRPGLKPQLQDKQHDVRILLVPDATPEEAARVRGVFQRFQRESATSFGRILDGSVTSQQILALSRMDATLWIEPAIAPKLFDEISTEITAGDDGIPGTNAWVHSLGYDGAGVSIAVVDSGLHEGDAETMHPDLAGRVDAFFHYGALTDAADEHSHGTHVAGIIAGNGAVNEKDDAGYLYGLGVAPGAHLVAQRIFDGDGAYHAPPSFTSMVRDSVLAGADIGSNSWGDDNQGRYDLTAAEFDALVRDADTVAPGDQPFILEFSAGNSGPAAQTIGTPAVAKNVIATGATENDRFDFYIYDSGSETMADFSSRGPCEDGRIKPDVVAPGTWIASLRSSLANDENAWGSISENYLYQGGTSQSGPHVSGAAAVFIQYYREEITNATPSAALVKAALINSAVDIDDGETTGPIPNNDEGWGRVDLVELIDSTRDYQFHDQKNLLTNGQVFEHRVLVASRDEPCRVTMVYTDVPGFPGAIPALVNNLDLEIIGPDGRVYRGNQFEEGESVPNIGAFDAVNNVESVYLSRPVPGEYIIRIHGRDIPEDARRDTPQVDQDFALVVSADIALPGQGVVFFDRGSYRAPGSMLLKLIDADLASQSTVNVQVRSTTEAGGENFILQGGGFGVFTAAVQIATGSAVNDGKLQVAHNDQITATYQDALPAGQRVATARCDLQAPIISNVSVTNRFGRTLVKWTTDEMSDSIVAFGTNTPVSMSLTNQKFTVSHELSLDGLVVGKTYYFLVSSADEAGNRATNNNGGVLFSFVAPKNALILLVDSYTDELLPVPPLSGYTDALNQVGISYEVWNVRTNGSPTATDLRPFEAVIWRVPEFFSMHAALSPAEQSALTTYLNQGGGLFIASMELLTRLESSGGGPFRSNVLHVLQYTEDVGADSVYGAENDFLTLGMDVALDYTAYEDDFKEMIGIPPDVSDSMVLHSNAAPILMETFGSIVGSRFPRVGTDSPGRVVFLSFPLDAVPLTGTVPNTRANLLRNILSFLVPGVNGVGTVALDSAAYRIPDRVTVEVADSDRAGSGTLTATFFSDTDETGQAVTLHETPRPGLFRGFITLVPHTSSVQPGEIRVQNGDLLWVEYFDASNNSYVWATAEIDVDPPTITGIVATPDYEDAIVEWQTSEPTDAQVQFGESTFLGRTAYVGELGESHSVFLEGLQPDRTYYFQVMSRDAAGNASVDNNNGALYTFRTAKPMTVPWGDNLETAATNWLVIDADESNGTWELGKPSNGWETSANSGTNAWGSNLNGGGQDWVETWLIGPAVQLPANTSTKLKFWHSYDFTDPEEGVLLEGGLVEITADNGRTWTSEVAYQNGAIPWSKAEIDLTRYAGRVVRFAFHYVLITFDNISHPGWLVDDVSIVSSTSGTIQITNNLAQARFTLSGAASANGGGWNTEIADAPPGNYTVTFNPVAYYQTPAPQSGTLTNSASLVFSGVYTFADANSNGISDAWETTYFGSVSPGRTSQTDTDGDGRSDYAEFIAGTVPTNAASYLRFTSIARTNSNVRLQWNSVPDRAYQVLGTPNLSTWTSRISWQQATGATSTVIIPANTNAASFFRLEVKP